MLLLTRAEQGRIPISPELLAIDSIVDDLIDTAPGASFYTAKRCNHFIARLRLPVPAAVIERTKRVDKKPNDEKKAKLQSGNR
jgi:hypothetical protein